MLLVEMFSCMIERSLKKSLLLSKTRLLSLNATADTQGPCVTAQPYIPLTRSTVIIIGLLPFPQWE